MSRRTSSELLEEAGYAIGCAPNGREALAYLRDDLPSVALIFLDLMMPGVDGFQCRAEQKRDLTLAVTPTVVMTARGATERAGLDADGSSASRSMC
ncbi:response regulator [Sorangium sp. So ce1000]|uniref:response regulator n=1 Tax=Sorangium sp. So ce1000 TaxID=3133325 RepID=UPI003F62C676